jgi:alkaline phosphatase D
MKHFFHALLGATLIGMPLLVSAQTLVSPTAGPPPASKKLERSIAKSTEGLNFDPALAPFYHGVASGDPTPTRVVIWTRRTPGDDATQYLLGWQVATDLNFANVVRQGQVNATAAADFTAKVDVGQLQPETTYYYRFYDYASEAVSIAGRTRTAPAGSTDHLRFAVVSCNNYQAG